MEEPAGDWDLVNEFIDGLRWVALAIIECLIDAFIHSKSDVSRFHVAILAFQLQGFQKVQGRTEQ